MDLVCREFIAVAINGRMTMGRDNLEGKFVREDCALRLAGAGGNLVAVTAAGGKRDIRDGQLTLTVQSITDDAIRMRMEGFARLGSDFATADAAAEQKRTSAGNEPQLLGFLEFDRRKRALTRFDLVALGDTYGQLGGDLKYLYRPGRNPLGIAFELVPPDAPVADRTAPPRGMRFPKNYYATGG